MNQGPKWLLLRAGEVPVELAWLGPWEREHLATLRLPKRRADWLLGRWTAKQAVLRTPEFHSSIRNPADLEIRPTPTGRPQIFLNGDLLPVGVSLSHRAGAGLCALASVGSVGCDLEWIEKRSAGFIEDYFTSAEQSLIHGQSDPSLQAVMANGLWSAKESVLKLLGTGLRTDPRLMAVQASTTPQQKEWQPITVSDGHNKNDFQGWWRLQDSWIMTVVTETESRSPVAVPLGDGGDKVPAS